ncbi:hypothetical protein [Trueperella bernardiae]|uniref:hypothetical protein n=1 Tax=Trueperella bernardiae TaxID=59561 RepID=UPI0011AE5F65|nr:hypothetical protein [Trueperella bernardiae]
MMESKYFDVDPLEDIEFHLTEILGFIETFEEQDLSEGDDELTVDDFRTDVVWALDLICEACEKFGAEVLNTALTRAEMDEADAERAWEVAVGK